MLIFKRSRQERQERKERPNAPAYVARGGDLVFPHPAALRGVRVYSFLLDADRGALQALLDAWLNRPSGGAVKYVALAPYVALTCVHNDSISSVHPEASGNGSVEETDFSFWAPALGMKRAAGLWIPDRLVWLPAYIFVDDIYALAAGRELYGFPKTLGRFRLPESPEEASRFTLETPAFRVWSAAERCAFRPVLDVSRVEGAPPGASRDPGGVEEALLGLRRLLVEGQKDTPAHLLSLLAGAFERLGPKRLRFVFLKQFRGVGDSTRACYQAITEATTEIVATRGGGLLPGPYRLTLHHLDSHPIARDLGLVGEGEGEGNPRVLPVRHAFWGDFDCTLDEGEEIWRAP